MAIAERDVQIGKNVRKLRGDMTQEELAARLRARGYKWSKATVWAIETGSRPLKLTEAQDLMQVLGDTSSDDEISVLLRSTSALQLDKITEVLPTDMAQLTRIFHNFWWAHQELGKLLENDEDSLDEDRRRTAKTLYEDTAPEEILSTAAAQMYLTIDSIKLSKKKGMKIGQKFGHERLNKHAKYDNKPLIDLAGISGADLRDYFERLDKEISQENNADR